MNDEHLVILTGELITARGGGTRGFSNFERSYSNVAGYALGQGLTEVCGVVIED